jgi:DNA (cytosine-5)-methyltransferase 1
VKEHSLISLFSGAGGMDLGFKMNGGFNLLLANDILPTPALTYAANFGHTTVDISEFNQSGDRYGSIYVLGDISEIDFTRISNQVDVVIGGPPCQDFSVVRGTEKERQGIKVKRGRLYSHFIRALIYLQPKIFVFENVPGLKSANKGTAYKGILEDFSELRLGWDEIKKIIGSNDRDRVRNYVIVFSGIVDSAYLGAPQRRKRLIIIGIREDFVDKNLFGISKMEREAKAVLYGKNSKFAKYPLTPLEVFEGRPLPELQDKYAEVMEEYKNIGEAVNTENAQKWVQEVWNKLSFNIIEDYLLANCIDKAEYKVLDAVFEEHSAVLKELGYYKERLQGKTFPDCSNAVPNEANSVADRLKMIPPDENHEFVRGTEWEVEGRGISLIYRRLHPLKPSYTVVAYGGGGTWGYHYDRHRGKLTNRERARLQTFPDSFLFHGSPAEVRAQIGEAVPPLLGKRIAQVVKTILDEE